MECEVATLSPTPKEILDTSHATVVAVEGMLQLQTLIFLEMVNFHIRYRYRYKACESDKKSSTD